jgi:hypothetical protein
MKRITMLLVLLALTNLKYCYAQFYNFEHKVEPYVEFDDGQRIDNDFQNENYYFQLPRWFKLFDGLIDSPLIVGKNGFAVVTTPEFSFAMDPFIAGLEKRDNSSSLTGKFDTLSNGSITAKIQWKNMGLQKHDPGDFVNFQLWIKLDSQLVEFHYGPSRVTSDSAFEDGNNQGPQIVLAKLKPDFSSVYEIFAVYNDNGVPKSLFQSFDTYTGAPADGTVMRFVANNLSSVKPIVGQTHLAYPNPVSNTLNLNGSFSGNEEMSIYDVNGKEVLRIDEIGDRREFDLSPLSSGVYYLLIETANNVLRQKIIKNHQVH